MKLIKIILLEAFMLIELRHALVPQQIEDDPSVIILYFTTSIENHFL